MVQKRADKCRYRFLSQPTRVLDPSLSSSTPPYRISTTKLIFNNYYCYYESECDMIYIYQIYLVVSIAANNDNNH